MPTPEDYKDFQILGSNVTVILDGFGSFTLLASKILLESGLGKPDAEGVGMAVLDSVGKGGAHVAIENLNIMAGLVRTAGLLDRGRHP